MAENNFITAEEYLKHFYEIPKLPSLPLADENFVSDWQEVKKMQ